MEASTSWPGRRSRPPQQHPPSLPSPYGAHAAAAAAAAACNAAAAAAGPVRGQKRYLADVGFDAASLLSHDEVHRLQGNAMRLRGLLTNVSATPDKRRLSQHLRGEITHLDRFLMAGMEDLATRHNPVRPRLMPVSNRQQGTAGASAAASRPLFSKQ